MKILANVVDDRARINCSHTSYTQAELPLRLDLIPCSEASFCPQQQRQLQAQRVLVLQRKCGIVIINSVQPSDSRSDLQSRSNLDNRPV